MKQNTEHCAHKYADKAYHILVVFFSQVIPPTKQHSKVNNTLYKIPQKMVGEDDNEDDDNDHDWTSKKSTC